VNPIEKFNWYRKEYGLAAAVRRILGKLVGRDRAEERPPVEQFAVQITTGSQEAGDQMITASQLIKARFSGSAPLAVFEAPGPRLRLNLVTDSINSGSLFGGVGTAIILATLLAKRAGAELRVVTRTQSPYQPSFREVLLCNGIEYENNVDFSFVDIGDKDSQLDICAGDYFLTTSWWTTASTLGSVAPSRLIYLLQEDERMFYPYGDDWLRCSETISRQDVAIVLNTRLLRHHLASTGLPHLAELGLHFEPAFPAVARTPKPSKRDGATRKRLFFYARPNNLRNVFYRGIEALDEAVRTGIIDPDRWEIVLVGKDVPTFSFSGVVPTIMPTLSWSDYGDFVGTVDLGFCLMATPHPSYPPLDLAAAGALVVTNKFGVKQDLSGYSSSIIAAELDQKSLVEGLRQAVARIESGDTQARTHGLSDSWERSLAHVTEVLANNVLR
jgi:beta-1,2-rhamnosyltransferase WsaF-like protein